MARESMAERFARRSVEEAAPQVEAPKVRDVPRYESPVAAQAAAREAMAARQAVEAPKRQEAQARAMDILNALDPEAAAQRAAFLKKMEARNNPPAENAAASNVVDINTRAMEAKMNALRDGNDQVKADHRRTLNDNDQLFNAKYRKAV